ncbi:uncharacterized protein BO72DRAFT_430915 [Aspergillus fijiensis CBS 313.89]|uniref:F-box domain-containing protein n=1 Tax=Aspergillus fijiensis CBS 313.89 TaxID=1448319 RepID=A0A8G1RRU1_9EURO|nr:uncharacterized protein BO72DRAFT_430915 [Aspergillus fijiensis CBS 313.89]RAK76376.1 hypothetical protein BO72DRAFT_430915 [Aspergillus fijiensis CBS 313.89]
MLVPFPGEIVFQVVSSLNTKDLSQMVLVSKDYYSFFIPVLYDQVILPLNAYWDDGYRLVGGSHKNPVRRFCQAMIENPRLAPLIRSLTLYPSHCEKWRTRAALPAVPEAKLRALMLPYGDAKRKHRRKYRAWRRDLRPDQERQDMYHEPWNYEDAWLALLLVQVRNLERLAIRLPEEHMQFEFEHIPLTQGYTTHFDRVIHWARNPALGILPRLSHVSLRDGPAWWDEGATNAVPLRRLLTYLRIPSLRSLYIRNPCDSSLPRQLLREQIPILSSLTHIDLQGPSDSLSNLPQFLEWCPNLESFAVEMDRNWTRRGWVDVSKLYRPLQRSRASLRHLHVAFTGVAREVEQDAESPRPTFCGDLSGFANLHAVHMRWSSLLPFHSNRALEPAKPLRALLPPSLQHLYIEDCLVQASWALASELEDLLRFRREEGGLPALQRLFCQFVPKERHHNREVAASSTKQEAPEPDPAWEVRLRGMQEGFRALGVSLRVIGRGASVSFPPDRALRHKWPMSENGEYWDDD